MQVVKVLILYDHFDVPLYIARITTTNIVHPNKNIIEFTSYVSDIFD